MSLEGTAEATNGMKILRGKISSLSTYALDTTLSVEGSAAEAKAVGDALEKKVNISDIADNLTTNNKDMPLSAKQGVVLKTAIDTLIATNEDMAININTAQSTADTAKATATTAQATAETAQNAAESANAAAITAQNAAETASKSAESAAASVDGVSPAKIGAEERRLQFTDVPVFLAGFVEDATYTDFPYRAAVELTGVTANMTPEVVFNVAEAKSGIYAPVTACYDGGIYLYANAVPEADIAIPTIICWKGVG